MSLLRSIKRVQAKPETSIGKRTEPPAPALSQPTVVPTPEDLRAATQEFGTGLRSRLGGHGAISW